MGRSRKCPPVDSLGASRGRPDPDSCVIPHELDRKSAGQAGQLHGTNGTRPWMAAVQNRNCFKHVRSNSVPSRLLPNSCLLNPGRGPKSNRTSRLLSGSFYRKATKFIRTRGFTKLTCFRNTENLVNPLFSQGVSLQ